MTLNTPENAESQTGLALELLSEIIHTGALPDDFDARIISWAKSTDSPNLAVISLAALALSQWGRYIVEGLGGKGAQDYIDAMRFNRLVGTEDWSGDE